MGTLPVQHDLPDEFGSTERWLEKRCHACQRVWQTTQHPASFHLCPHCGADIGHGDTCPACSGVLSVVRSHGKVSGNRRWYGNQSRVAETFQCQSCGSLVYRETGHAPLIGESRSHWRAQQPERWLPLPRTGEWSFFNWRRERDTTSDPALPPPTPWGSKGRGFAKAQKFWDNDSAHKVVADEIDKFRLQGVSFDELRDHLARLFRSHELKPKYLRGWVERCIKERLIVCREGRYFRVFSMNDQETEKDSG